MKSYSHIDDKYRAIQEELAHLSLLPNVVLAKDQFFALLDQNVQKKLFFSENKFLRPQIKVSIDVLRMNYMIK